jgi:hypothetical protein
VAGAARADERTVAATPLSHIAQLRQVGDAQPGREQPGTPDGAGDRGRHGDAAQQGGIGHAQA